MKRWRLRKNRRKKSAKVDRFDYVVAVTTGALLGGVVGFVIHPWTGAVPGIVVGVLMGVAFPKLFFVIGDAIVSALF